MVVGRCKAQKGTERWAHTRFGLLDLKSGGVERDGRARSQISSHHQTQVGVRLKAPKSPRSICAFSSEMIRLDRKNNKNN